MPDEAQVLPDSGTSDPPEHPGHVDWYALIEAAAANRPEAITAQTYLGKFEGSASNPVKVRCSDGENYAVKGPRAGRMIFNDQVAARLGRLIGADVPDVAVADLPQMLIDANPGTMGHLGSGYGHASKVIEGCSGKLGVQHIDEGDNRGRFARLAIFFGWMGGSDQQFIYNKSAPHLVHSVDHGHFFYGGPDWTAEKLKQAPAARADANLMQHCNFTPQELADACARLREVTPEQIAEAVAVPPDDWGVSMDERVGLAEYLEKRRADLVAAYIPQADQEDDQDDRKQEGVPQ